MPRVEVNGIELCYESMGRGEPLLLIMGLGGQMIGWDDRLCEMLVTRGFRVIRFDNRDVGCSTRLDHLGAPRMEALVARGFLGMPLPVPYTLRDMTADTIGLLDALGIDSAHVVGASMGGMIAQLMAIEHPHRLRTMTSVMSHPSNWRSKVVHPRVMRAMLAPPPRTDVEQVDRLIAIARLIHGSGFPFEEDHTRQYLARAFDRGTHIGGVMRQIGAIAAAENRTPALRRVRVPALVMHGTDDPLVPPACALATARAIPDARLCWIRGMGHSLPRGAWPQIVQALAGHTRVRASAVRAKVSPPVRPADRGAPRAGSGPGPHSRPRS